MSMAGSLQGMRVVDASSYLTGPFATMLLADLGADVTKVEPPRGDPFRRLGRRVGDTSVPFSNANRNKRSVTLDLHASADRDELERLLAGADVLVTNWRPDTTRRLGLDDSLLGRHPQLVWIRISGFGPDGPDVDAPAFDAVIQARSGIAWVEGEGLEPRLVHSWICDKVTGMFAAQAAMAGLLRRGRTGRGGATDIAMLDVMAYFNFPDLMTERTRLADAGPAINRQTFTNRPVRTSDGWILICPVSGRQLSAALTALGLDERKSELLAVTDPNELADVFGRLAESVTPSRPAAHWLAAFAAHDVPVAPISTLDDHLRDPQIVHNGVYREIDHPQLGCVRAPHHPAAPGGAIAASPALDGAATVAPSEVGG